MDVRRGWKGRVRGWKTGGRGEGQRIGGRHNGIRSKARDELSGTSGPLHRPSGRELR